MQAQDDLLLPPTTKALGRYTAAYSLKFQHRKRFIKIMIIIMIVMMIMILGIHLLLSPHSHPAINKGRMLGLIFCPIMFGIQILTTFKPKRLLVLFEGGFFYRSPLRSVLCKWEDIDKVYEESDRAIRDKKPRDRFWIFSHKGEGISFSEWDCPHARDVGELIQKRASEAMWPHALELLSSGQPIVYGPFIATSNSLRIKGKTIPWGEITGIQVEETGHVNILYRGKTLRTRAAYHRIPNVRVLTYLINHLGNKEVY